MICIATQMIFLLMIISSIKGYLWKANGHEVTLIDDDNMPAQLNKLLLKW
jgi:hypothetical protein